MTRFYVVRHGYTIGNKFDIVAGHIETDLTDVGREQARLIGLALADANIDAAYSSDLNRAYQTATIALGDRLEVHKDPALRELDFGKWDGMVYGEVAKAYPQDWEKWIKDYAHGGPTGGESIAQAYQRISSAICRIAKENEGKAVAIFFHGRIMQILLNWVKGVPWDKIPHKRSSQNGTIAIFDVKNEKPTLIKDVDGSHLGPLKTGPCEE